MIAYDIHQNGAAVLARYAHMLADPNCIKLIKKEVTATRVVEFLARLLEEH